MQKMGKNKSQKLSVILKNIVAVTRNILFK